MIIESHNGKSPKIEEGVFIAANATIIGDVHIKKGANIWYGAVLRGDVCKIIIGENTSIQDNCVVHSESGTTFEIGDNCIVGHLAMLHGPGKVGDKCQIGIGAKVLQRSEVGDGSIVGSGAVVLKKFPEKVLVVGMPAQIKRKLDDSAAESTLENAIHYQKNGQNFIDSGLNHPDIKKWK